jgi:hypothetical protein
VCTGQAGHVPCCALRPYVNRTTGGTLRLSECSWHRCSLRRSRNHGRGAEWPWWARRGHSVMQRSPQTRNRGLGEHTGNDTALCVVQAPVTGAQAVATFEAVNHPRCGVCCQICCNINTGSAQYEYAWRSPSCAGGLNQCCNRLWALAPSCGGPTHGASWSEVQCVERQAGVTGSHCRSCNVHLPSAGLHRLATRSLRPPSRGGCCTRGASSRFAATHPAAAVGLASQPGLTVRCQVNVHARCSAVEPSPHACSSAICGTVTRGAPSSRRRIASRTMPSSRSMCRSWWTAPGSRTGPAALFGHFWSFTPEAQIGWGQGHCAKVEAAPTCIDCGRHSQGG